MEIGIFGGIYFGIGKNTVYNSLGDFTFCEDTKTKCCRMIDGRKETKTGSVIYNYKIKQEIT